MQIDYKLRDERKRITSLIAVIPISNNQYNLISILLILIVVIYVTIQTTFFLFKQVNWKYNPGVKYYKFKIIYTKLVQY